MTDIIFATGNQGKLKEIRAIIGDKFNVLSMKDVSIDVDIVEDGLTFEENAFIKARTISQLTNKIVLADDSGLEIDFLDKAPGIYSARYMGEDTPYSVKNAKILELLKDVPQDKRSARFVCSIAAVLPGEYGNKEFSSTKTIEGSIAYEIQGENGFGYDPIFFVPEFNKTTAQLTPEEKNQISHRGKALRQIKEILVDFLGEK